jgi:hypothetical protein
LHAARVAATRLPVKTLFITDVFGQLGNRLFRSARLQLDKPAEVALLDLTLCDYARLYQPCGFGRQTVFRFLGLFDGRFVSRLHALVPRVAQQHVPAQSRRGSAPPLTTSCQRLYSEILASPRFLHHVERHSYYFDCVPPSPAGKARLREIFRLRERYELEASRLMARIPQNSTIVAVHIRRGDYREYAGGKSFFDDSVYLQAVTKLQASHGAPPNLAFIPVSDEVLDAASFDRAGIHYFGPQSLGVDQAILSRSSYILGPSSTFSAWPAFLHDIPRAEIGHRDNLPGWGDFSATDANFRTESPAAAAP